MKLSRPRQTQSVTGDLDTTHIPIREWDLYEPYVYWSPISQTISELRVNGVSEKAIGRIEEIAKKMVDWPSEFLSEKITKEDIDSQIKMVTLLLDDLKSTLIKGDGNETFLKEISDLDWDNFTCVSLSDAQKLIEKQLEREKTDRNSSLKSIALLWSHLAVFIMAWTGVPWLVAATWFSLAAYVFDRFLLRKVETRYVERSANTEAEKKLWIIFDQYGNLYFNTSKAAASNIVTGETANNEIARRLGRLQEETVNILDIGIPISIDGKKCLCVKRYSDWSYPEGLSLAETCFPEKPNKIL